MANKTSLIIETQEVDRAKQQLTITNVNPNATDAECFNFGEAIANLSSRTFSGIYKVTRTELERPQGGE